MNLNVLIGLAMGLNLVALGSSRIPSLIRTVAVQGVLLAENCRVPFDDPSTHLELTMIHEVMVLDHSGPPLAVILHGASLKLLLFTVLLTESELPVGAIAPAGGQALLVAGVLAITLAVGLVESLLARFAFRRVPLLLLTAVLLCLFALLVAWQGGPVAT